MKKIITLSLIFSLFSFSAFSQSRFSYGAEFGINTVSLPYKSTDYYSNNQRTSNFSSVPVFGPVLGIWTKFNFGKHFFSSLSVNYRWQGYQSQTNEQYFDRLKNTTAISSATEKLSMQKITIPLTFGYDFRIRKMKSNFYLGVLKNYYTQGQYYESFSIQSENNNASKEEQAYTRNIFDKQNYYFYPAKRLSSGLIVGLGFDITKKFNLNLNYSISEELGFTSGCIGFYPMPRTEDFTVTLKYKLK